MKFLWRRSWLDRRIVWSADFIYIARLEDDDIIDAISLADALDISTSENLSAAAQLIPNATRGPRRTAENRTAEQNVTSIRRVCPEENAAVFQESETVSEESASAKAMGPDKGASKPRDKAAVLEIKTLPDGYNSGRTYYLRIKPVDRCKELASDFLLKAAVARRRKEASSRFRRNQRLLRTLTDSTLFQCTGAFLIFLVRASHPPPHLPCHDSCDTQYPL